MYNTFDSLDEIPFAVIQNADAAEFPSGSALNALFAMQAKVCESMTLSIGDGMNDQVAIGYPVMLFAFQGLNQTGQINAISFLG